MCKIPENSERKIVFGHINPNLKHRINWCYKLRLTGPYVLVQFIYKDICTAYGNQIVI